jgi:hypothetical protein
MAHAVESQTSGPVTLLGRATGPSERRQPELPEPTTPTFRREGGAAIEDTVSPRDERTTHEGRSTDFSRLIFSLPMVLAIVGTALTVSGTQYVFQAGQRAEQAQMASDIRSINDRLNSQKENLDLKFENLRLEMNNGELRKALLERMNPNQRTP